MPVTFTFVIAYFDLSHTAPNLPQCPVMFILITAAAVVVGAAGGRAPGGGTTCRTGLRGRPLFGASLDRAGFLGPLCCWTGLVVVWRSWRQRQTEREIEQRYQKHIKTTASTNTVTSTATVTTTTLNSDRRFYSPLCSLCAGLGLWLLSGESIPEKHIINPVTAITDQVIKKSKKILLRDAFLSAIFLFSYCPLIV